jgi:hypothetical protein
MPPGRVNHRRRVAIRDVTSIELSCRLRQSWGVCDREHLLLQWCTANHGSTASRSSSTADTALACRARRPSCRRLRAAPATTVSTYSHGYAAPRRCPCARSGFAGRPGQPLPPQIASDRPRDAAGLQRAVCGSAPLAVPRRHHRHDDHDRRGEWARSWGGLVPVMTGRHRLGAAPTRTRPAYGSRALACRPSRHIATASPKPAPTRGDSMVSHPRRPRRWRTSRSAR